MARRRKMDPERKAFINSLLEHYQPKDTQDIQDMLKDLLGETLQGMLEAEMDDHLGIKAFIPQIPGCLLQRLMPCTGPARSIHRKGQQRNFQCRTQFSDECCI